MTPSVALRSINEPARRETSHAAFAHGLALALAAGQAAALGVVLARFVMDGALDGPACAAWLVLAVFRLAVGFWADLASSEAGGQMKRRVRVRIAAALLRARYRDAETTAPLIVSALNDDIDALGAYGARYLPLRAAMGAGMAAALALAVSQSWLAGAIMLLTGPLIPLFMALVGYRAEEEAKGKLDALANMSRAFLGRVRRLDVIRAFGAIDREADRLAERAHAHRTASVGVLRIAFLSSATIDFFATLSIALIATYVGLSLLDLMPFSTGESITPVEGFVALMVAPEFYAPLRRFALAYHDRADALAAAERLAPLLALEIDAAAAPERDTQTHAPVGVLAVNALSAGYADGRESTPVSFEARPGEIVALWGPSGIGKSALLKTMAGLLDARGGDMHIDGALTADALAGRSILVGQRPYLLPGSVRANLAIADAAASDEVMCAALAQVGLAHAAAGVDLDRTLGDIAFGVSGGEGRRLTIARALLARAPVLLLDEPTAHLDSDTEQGVIDVLRQAARDRIVIVATHSPLLRAAASRVVDMAGP